MFFEANVVPQEHAEVMEPIEIAAACRVEMGAKCLVIARGALHEIDQTCRSQCGKKHGLLDLEVGKELDLISTLHLFDELRARDPVFERANDPPRQNETLMMVRREIAKSGVTLHDGFGAPAAPGGQALFVPF